MKCQCHPEASYELGVLAHGERPYLDRRYTIGEFPEEWQGATTVRTFLDDKKFDSGDSRFSFIVNRPVVLRVATGTNRVSGISTVSSNCRETWGFNSGAAVGGILCATWSLNLALFPYLHG